MTSLAATRQVELRSQSARSTDSKFLFPAATWRYFAFGHRLQTTDDYNIFLLDMLCVAFLCCRCSMWLMLIDPMLRTGDFVRVPMQQPESKSRVALASHWSQLPASIAALALSFLGDAAALIAFEITCKPWRAIAAQNDKLNPIWRAIFLREFEEESSSDPLICGGVEQTTQAPWKTRFALHRADGARPALWILDFAAAAESLPSTATAPLA